MYPHNTNRVLYVDSMLGLLIKFQQFHVRILRKFFHEPMLEFPIKFFTILCRGSLYYSKPTLVSIYDLPINHFVPTE